MIPLHLGPRHSGHHAVGTWKACVNEVMSTGAGRSKNRHKETSRLQTKLAEAFPLPTFLLVLLFLGLVLRTPRKNKNKNTLLQAGPASETEIRYGIHTCILVLP